MAQSIENTQIIVSFIFVGLIWTIQLAHYPSFHYVRKERFIEFEKFHTFRILLLVAPLMFLELVSSLALLYLNSFRLHEIIVLIIVALLWFVTFYWSVPCHKKLLKGKDKAVIDTLINTNWIRTFLWTLKVFIVYFIYY
ncbi:MAG: hypothetical protein JXN63_07025 [Candidatus Delongbacteria bacterium]|nr:hypothetical protein [Candidatus Delongbacteria bacterium]